MFGVNSTEIFVILGVLVLLFGGSKIPELARGIGQGIREFKSGIKEIKDPINDITGEIQNSVNGVARDINRETREIKQTIKNG